MDRAAVLSFGMPGETAREGAGIIGFGELEIIFHLAAINAGGGREIVIGPEIGGAKTAVDAENIGQQAAFHEADIERGGLFLHRVHGLEITDPDTALGQAVGQVDIGRRRIIGQPVIFSHKLEIADLAFNAKPECAPFFTIGRCRA